MNNLTKYVARTILTLARARIVILIIFKKNLDSLFQYHRYKHLLVLV